MIKLIPRLKPQWTLKDFVAALTPKKNAKSEYERAFAQKFGCEHGVMFSHGRSGLYALFKVWGLNQDEIVCPAYTCVVVQNAIVLSGNIPVFVDSEAPGKGFNMDPDLLRKAIGPKTRAVVVTHLFGYPMDVKRVQRIVEDAENKYGHKIYVIQDAAHSYGARILGGDLVTSYGDAAIFGSNISKIITSVFGGMVTTNQEETAEALRKYQKEHFKKNHFKGLKRFLYMSATAISFHPVVYGLVNWLERKGFLDRFVKYYDEGKIYFPSDWDQLPCSLEARVGHSQLSRYYDIIDSRVNNSKAWMLELAADERFRFLPQLEGVTFSHCVALVEDRDAIVEEYRNYGFQLGILIEYSVPEFQSYRKYRIGQDFPNAKYYSEHCINFPIWRGMEKYLDPSE
ncbi:DegT/DnrJ/EryC1/StrS family aminotransferase [Luteibaculum oceani]|uniref:DegT/DnrJ/EryC1/StrS family aminotransferase n=1 Tax=Luteibaculum oceani TaxID=1294296 RepID=A0A5C6V8V6_9FLAO|nr:DegT/DnrJ/EryC1/StrS family aminotransferase [Luteibaculum oceani]TXC81529.1 hypothetical protein FRX97_05845 [Luteibaculum oceani]